MLSNYFVILHRVSEVSKGFSLLWYRGAVKRSNVLVCFFNCLFHYIFSTLIAVKMTILCLIVCISIIKGRSSSSSPRTQTISAVKLSTHLVPFMTFLKTKIVLHRELIILYEIPINKIFLINLTVNLNHDATLKGKCNL